ncbi:type IV toxin-antitoxin system AbiEi family antitoxin domain-containing protein [Meiothermus cerbereus]|uniref:type IV toxin-antitoxin system AbiEi family antitoxin domain-containing protein n=1 Tax=Meiothermus cerbereus TaxID=65552 RepID=UPI000480A68F|nr:type IV toxin-antitoxin system AbiEi family antitoxin domain-containing protein [Meiothermus cerbereus]
MGVEPYLLTRWVQQGRFERIQRGVYRQHEAEVGSHRLKVYGPEKTLADLLKFSNRYGEDLFLEGLKNYLACRQPCPDLLRLLEAARVCRVERRLRPGCAAGAVRRVRRSRIPLPRSPPGLCGASKALLQPKPHPILFHTAAQQALCQNL